MEFKMALVEKLALTVGLLGLIGFALVPFNSGIVQTQWFFFFAAFSIFALRFFSSSLLKMPERVALLGFSGNCKLKR